MAKQNLKMIKRIIIHCAATPPTMDIGVDTIRKWHLERGWDDVGYHFIIRRSGAVEEGRPLDEVGCHTAGKNTGSIGVCLVGGITKKGDPEMNFTDEQWSALQELVHTLMEMFQNATVHGHNEFSPKACPSFNVQHWLKQIHTI